MTTAFNPIAKEYQVDPRHSPDKGSTWQYPEEDDGWILTHNALRGEMGCMKEAIDMVMKRGEFQQWEIEALQTIWDAHYVFVDAHHHNEDDKIQPIFAARVRYPEKVRVVSVAQVTLGRRYRGARVRRQTYTHCCCTIRNLLCSGRCSRP